MKGSERSSKGSEMQPANLAVPGHGGGRIVLELFNELVHPNRDLCTNGRRKTASDAALRGGAQTGGGVEWRRHTARHGHTAPRRLLALIDGRGN